MKRKQKRILMIVLGVAAAVLCAVQLGPIVLGKPSPYVDPKKKNKKATKKKSAKLRRTSKRATSGRRGRSQKPPSGRRGRRRKPPPEDDDAMFAGLPLDEVVIDLSKIGRRVFSYRDNGLRNPFAPPTFETAVKENPLLTIKVKLNGVIAGGQRPLAIIGNRVYGEGDEIVPGVKVLSIKSRHVDLTDGENRLRLRLTTPNLTLGRS